MTGRYVASQKGFSFIKLLLWIVVLAVGVSLLPTLLSTVDHPIANDVLQKLGQARISANSLLGRVIGVFGGLAKYVKEKALALWEKILILKEKVLAKGEKLLVKYGVSSGSRGIEWDRDMRELLKRSKDEGFKLEKTNTYFDKYRAGEARQITVESEYWKEMRRETEALMVKSGKALVNRTLGCSNFTYEFQLLKQIREQFNDDSFTGYVEARKYIEQLKSPHSREFLEEFLGRLVEARAYSPSFDWYVGKLNQAISQPSGKAVYPQIIAETRARIQSTQNPFEQVVGNITIGEIYLSYDLFNPAEARFDEAIRIFLGEMARYHSTIPPEMALGLHMGAGLLHQRVCKNGDRAIKEFKDVVGIARNMNLEAQYSIAHYNLGMLYLYFKDQMKVEFKKASISVPAGTTPPAPVLAATPTPAPLATVTPRPIDIDISISIPRSLDDSGREERPGTGGIPPVVGTPVGVSPPIAAPVPTQPPQPTSSSSGVIKGTIIVPRMERPTADLGKTLRMERIDVGDIFDLSRVPADANRELELYLKYVSEGSEAEIARLIHQKYLGR